MIGRSRPGIPVSSLAAARPLLGTPARPAAGSPVPNSSRSVPLRHLAGPRWPARSAMEEFGTRSRPEGFADDAEAVTVAAAGSPAGRGPNSSNSGARPVVAPSRWPARPAMEEFGTEPAWGGRP